VVAQFEFLPCTLRLRAVALEGKINRFLTAKGAKKGRQVRKEIQIEPLPNPIIGRRSSIAVNG
jgi:hypothetical protein